MAAKERIDKLLVDRGLAESRTKAQAMVMAGEVVVGDHRIDKAGQLVDPTLPIRLRGGQRYVSRGALKLQGALDGFGIDPTGLRAVDLGASTGGFTDLLLQRGAEAVWAVDVGYGQLHDKLRKDPRVHVFERVNARHLTLEALGDPPPFDLAVMDLSFISSTLVLPAAAGLLAPGGRLIVLVKPQFELAPGDVEKGGVVKDPAKRQEAIHRVREACEGLGLRFEGVIDAPIKGPAGNHEALLVAVRPS